LLNFGRCSVAVPLQVAVRYFALSWLADFSTISGSPLIQLHGAADGHGLTFKRNPALARVTQFAPRSIG
jgi:hypothetical protein